MVAALALLAQTVRTVGDHDGGHAQAFIGLGVPEVGAVQEVGLLLEGQLAEDLLDIECLGGGGCPYVLSQAARAVGSGVGAVVGGW